MSPQPGRFSGKTALVTGAASGIGAATARRLAREGAAVAILDLDIERGEAVAKAIVGDGGTACFIPTDVARAEDWQSATELASTRYGGIDVVHSNAFLHVAGGPETLTIAEWHRVLDVNLTALYLAAAVTIDHLVSRRGNIVVTSSVHGKVSLRNYSAYAAAKGGLDALVRQLAVQYAPVVRVNAVVPGPVDTGRWSAEEGSAKDSAGRATLLGRVGTAAEVAAAVCFLASEEASFITGTSLCVDGGWSLQKDSA